MSSPLSTTILAKVRPDEVLHPRTEHIGETGGFERPMRKTRRAEFLDGAGKSALLPFSLVPLISRAPIQALQAHVALSAHIVGLGVREFRSRDDARRDVHAVFARECDRRHVARRCTLGLLEMTTHFIGQGIQKPSADHLGRARLFSRAVSG